MSTAPLIAPKSAMVIAAVALTMRVSEAELKSADKSARLHRPRCIATWLLRQHTKLSYPKIGQRMGGRDHSTIIEQHRRAAQMIETDPSFAASVRDCESRLTEGRL